MTGLDEERGRLIESIYQARTLRNDAERSALSWSAFIKEQTHKLEAHDLANRAGRSLGDGKRYVELGVLEGTTLSDSRTLRKIKDRKRREDKKRETQAIVEEK